MINASGCWSPGVMNVKKIYKNNIFVNINAFKRQSQSGHTQTYGTIIMKKKTCEYCENTFFRQKTMKIINDLRNNPTPKPFSLLFDQVTQTIYINFLQITSINFKYT